MALRDAALDPFGEGVELDACADPTITDGARQLLTQRATQCCFSCVRYRIVMLCTNEDLVGSCSPARERRDVERY